MRMLFQLSFTFLVPLTIALAVATVLTADGDVSEILGKAILLIALWRIALSIYRRLILPPKAPLAYGKWAIVTGSTSGIGKDFTEYLSSIGMSLVIISRSESKLIEQRDELLKSYPDISVKYLSFDFSHTDENRANFYALLESECESLHSDGGIGILVNNVGTANEIPKRLTEFSVKDTTEIMNTNIFSQVLMTKTVLPFMRLRKNGAIVSISSGSGNHCGPFLSLYSATKAFMTQFSRSLHIENWGSGVDFIVVTPFYIVSNLYKRKTGNLISPMPRILTEGTFAHLGKKYIWQGHGYWFHGFLGNMAQIIWITTARYRKMMVDNRTRFDERVRKGK